MRQCYSVGGMTISLPFPCPNLPHADTTTPLLSMEEGFVPRTLETASHRCLHYDAAPGRFLFRGGARSGRFLVEDGCRLRLQRNTRAEDDALSFHFLHAVLAALLRQRGHVVLHGNAVAGPDGAILVCGPSGAGKSTTTAALLSCGWSALSDDVTGLDLCPSGAVSVLPGAPQVSLCVDAAQRLMPGLADLPRNPLQRDKVTLPVQYLGQSTTMPVPLKRIVILSPDGGDQVRTEDVFGTDKFAAVQECVYGPVFPAEHRAYFQIFAALGQQVSVLRISRPRHRWSLDQVVEMTGHG